MNNLSSSGGGSTEEFSKTFSLKLADKLEKQEVDIAKACQLMQEFLQLAKEESEEKVQQFIDRI
jgi:hypothetical protein